MGIITKIEDKLGDIVEKPFRSKKGFEPLIVEVTIRRRLEAKKKNILGKIVVPHSISIIFDEAVYNDFKPFFEHFRASMTKSLSEWTRENGYEMLYELDLQFKKGSLDEHKFDVFVSYRREGAEPSKSDEQPKGCHSREGGNPGAGSILRRMDSRLRNSGMTAIHTLAKGYEMEFSEQNSKTTVVVGTLRNAKTGDKYEIRGGETIIGRDKDCDVTISDPTVSRIHAFLSNQHNKVILEDLGSVSGTRVNHEKVSEKMLADGDRVLMGDTELIFCKPEMI